jgi:hypothetical protein
MVSEALRIAETEPILLDLCGELDFVGVENWSSLCMQRKWLKPEPIDGKAVQALNDAYSSGQSLEPLLKEYRRAVREHRTKECVRLLRRIAAIDAANPNWVGDLKGFEERRLTEIRNEYKAAKLADDAETLAALMVEINDDWKIPRDQVLRDEVRDAARALYEKQAMVVGRSRIQEVAKAYAAMDFDRLATVIAAYESLLRDGYLKPDGSMTMQFDEAKEWLQQETKRRKEEKVYAETLGTLRVAVEKGDAKPLEEVLNVLTRFDRPIPDRLEERAHELIETHRFAMERVRKRRMVTVAITLVLAAAGIAALVSRQRYDAAKAELRAALEKTYQEEDLESLKKLLVGAEHDDPRIFRDPEIQSWVRKRAQLASELEKKHVAFEHTLARLDSIRESRFTESAMIVDGLIAEARANVTPGAAQGRLAIFLREWSSHKEALQAEVDRTASAKIDEVAVAIETLTRSAAQTTVGLREKYLAIRETAQRVEQSLEQVSAEQQIRLSALLGRLDVLVNELDGKERQLAVVRDARTLREYLDALKTQARAFPNDALSKSVGGVLALETSYVQLLEAPIRCSSNNPFWFAAYRQREDLVTGMQEKWPVIKARLMDLNAESRYTSLWEIDTANVKVFFEGAPTFYPNGMKKFEGMFYIPKAGDIQPEFKQQTLDANRITSASLMPHCDFVLGLVSLARFSNESKAYDDLVRELQKVGTNSNISPLLRLRLADMLLDCLTDMVGTDLTTEWNSLRQDIKSIDPDLHWLCVQHRDVRLANEKADAILKRHFSSALSINQSRFMSDVRDLSLKRNVKWVAYAGLANGLDIEWKLGAQSAEIWVVRASEAGLPQIILAAESQPKGFVRYLKFIPGEPLFAPTDGRLTRDALASMKQKHSMRETNLLKWVNSWPANFHQ